ncbi:exodeoxyribonuclease V subunit beta [Gammaproteobacteria bacterium LSUCC0112]|nr:exodeoxyribonuclease V subunit beta [Gammaproteobacteria bacterium LSUCC0112]
MSTTLDIRRFPLYGSRLIEASAGTGKTWTIALLYTRLILQHGREHAFNRPLTPDQILVVTFTDAATQELKDRIRARLSDAARCFISEATDADPALLAIRADYDPSAWQQCARLLSLAAQAMDQSAVSTIHSWCYRMLREHAFDSGSLFQQTLVNNQRDMLSELIRDYWRQHFYALDAGIARAVQSAFRDPDSLLKAVRPLINKTGTRLSFIGENVPEVSDLQTALQPFAQHAAALEQLENEARAAWLGAQTVIESLLDNIRPALNQNSYKETKSDDAFSALKERLAEWANGGERPAKLNRFSDQGWTLKKLGKIKPDQPEHPAFTKIAELLAAGNQLEESTAPDIRACILAHASHWLEHALHKRLQEKAELGFDDLLLQLDRALQGPQGEHLARQIRRDFPVAMIDEFQDTDPLQYRIFDRIYQLASNHGTSEDCDSAIILIGDPKQAIYSFRNADIHTYLQARTATAGRHYNLAVNYRSSVAVVEAVNYLFSQAEAYPTGAFRFKTDTHNPLPFLSVAAKGREEHLIIKGNIAHAIHIWHGNNPADDTAAVPSGHYKKQMAANCALTIAQLLSEKTSGFSTHGVLQPLCPKDIAILVRSRSEADEVRQVLNRVGLASVYLSDRESVFDSQEAADVVIWLSACAEPGNEQKLRAALATVSLALPMTDLRRMLDDEFFWEEQTALFRQLNTIWWTQGVLTMLRMLMQHYHLPQRLIGAGDGERRLTNLLHLAEYLQKASQQHDGEQALIRHLAEQINEPDEEEILRLESDDDLIRVVTIHKSKGLEYPLVFLPFAAAFRSVDHHQQHVMIMDNTQPGFRRLEISGRSKDLEAWQQADQERLTEDLRLLYVALTRARHALWIGISSISVGNSRSSSLHQSALGYLMAAGDALPAAVTSQVLERWTADCHHINCQLAEPAESALDKLTMLMGNNKIDVAPALSKAALVSMRSPAENWWIASYSSLKTLGLGARTHNALSPEIARDDQVMEEAVALITSDTASGKSSFSRQNPGLHGFHRGPEPGTFLHSLLEWAVDTGFVNAAENHVVRQQEIRTACELRGWLQESERLDKWLSDFIKTDFQLMDSRRDMSRTLNLCKLEVCQAELEFLFATHQVETTALDQLCHQYLLPGLARPALLPSQLNGMIKGFIDLVFLDKGQYYVADWKSNYLGPTDAHYTREAIQTEVLDKRYDVQYAIYLLALHRLLGSRLVDYDYEKHVGGAVYFFLRGWQSASQGLLVDKPPRAFMDALNQLFLTGTAQVQHA